MKRIFLTLIIVLSSLAGFSQLEKHVFWTFDTEQISDNEYYIIFKAKIDPHWHLYAPSNPPGGSLPLTIEFDNTEGFSAEGGLLETAKPIVQYDDIFQKDEYFYENQAVFKQKIKLTKEGKITVSGTLSGQVCLPDGKCINFNDPFEVILEGKKIAKEQQITQRETQKTEDIQVADNNDDTVKKITTVEIKKDSLKNIDTAGISLKPTGFTPILVKDNPWKDVGQKHSMAWFFWISFLLGLAALLTPCVFPMVPMTVSFFIKGKDSVRGKLNALIYGLSIVVIYTLPIAIIIGIAQIFGGENISADFANWLSTHWIPNLFFFFVFMFFAASFFGMFEITLPHWMVNSVSKKSGQGGLVGIFFLAFTLVLVSFSCTGPIVGGILVESTQGGAIIKPLVGMLGFSLGVALPFTIFAFFPSMLQKLPKSGGWLNSVKVVLGFIELALGLKFLSVADQTYHWGLLNREVYLALWIAIFSLMAIYLMGKIKFAHDSDLKYISVPRLFLIILTWSFVIYMIPGMFGAPLKPLSGYLPPKTTQDFDIERYTLGEGAATLCDKPMYSDQLHLPHNLKGYFDVYQALNCAKEQKKPIFVDFTGHGCVNCRKMEEFVWSDPRVLKILQNDYIILSLYVDDKTIQVPEDRWFISLADNKLKKTLGKQNSDIQIVNFNKNAQPYYVLIDWEGNVLAQPVEYDTDVNKFIKFLEEGKSRFKQLHPFGK